MAKKRQTVKIADENAALLIKELFKQKVPDGILVRENQRTITHYHSYGGLSQFFQGLVEGKIMGTQCAKCGEIKVWIPPRVHCPDCWEKMAWVVVQPYGAKVYSHSMANLPGAGFKGSAPCPLISVEIPGVWTRPMGYLLKFGKGEPYIGMPVKPVFRKKNPTYTILDLAWVPIDKKRGRRYKKIMLELKKEKWIKKLAALPENGMGYHIVDITLKDGRVMERVAVLNCSFVDLPVGENISEDDIAELELRTEFKSF